MKISINNHNTHREYATSEIKDKADAFWRNNAGSRPKNLYDGYKYTIFWRGREYENAADRMAVRRLIKEIIRPRETIVDVGGGIGRLASLYENSWKHAVILDPSRDQLAVARQNVDHPEKIDFVEGVAESIPLPAAFCDTALCVRVFHYIEEPRAAIREIRRILAPGGYLILEIPNKVHMKSKIKNLLRLHALNSYKPISKSKNNRDVIFLNHHPDAIRTVLLMEQFEIVSTLSVSNFRNPFLKKIISLKTLLFFERLLQRPFARWRFGPSIYFLARKTQNVT